MTETDLDGRVIVITGAAGEIPFAVARLAADAGARLVLSDVNTDRLAAQAATLPDGPDPLLLRQDVADPVDALALAAQCDAAHGRVDVLINGAGLYEHRPLGALDAASWRRCMAVNLDGVFHTIHALQDLLSQGSAVVNIASHSGHQGSPGHSAYAAAKGGCLR
ncbi:MAG: SDR family oxidoreductase [Marinibacterium sp.]|nr:SDR family oxidoreductase [Marinibacterium sp.]